MPEQPKPQREDPNAGGLMNYIHIKTRRGGMTHAYNKQLKYYLVTGKVSYDALTKAFKYPVRQVGNYRKAIKKKKPSEIYETRGGFRIKKLIHPTPNTYYKTKEQLKWEKYHNGK